MLRLSHFRRSVFIPAVEATGLTGLTPHGLRHTAASLAIASGADVKVVQTMSDRKSATTTLDRYGHLYAERSTKSPIGWTRPALPVRPIRGRLFKIVRLLRTNGQLIKPRFRPMGLSPVNPGPPVGAGDGNRTRTFSLED